LTISIGVFRVLPTYRRVRPAVMRVPPVHQSWPSILW
jgi:hypothetical protein